MNPIEQLLRIIAPFACTGCGAEGALLCATCERVLPGLPPRCYRCNRATAEYRTCVTCRRSSTLARVWVRTPYQGAAKQLIHQLKFERAASAARDIAASLAAILPSEDYQ